MSDSTPVGRVTIGLMKHVNCVGIGVRRQRVFEFNNETNRFVIK